MIGIMKILVKLLLLFLLLFTGFSAVYGGWHLIKYPDGSSLKLPLEYLSNTPFIDYRLPGILLFSTIGVYSLALFSMVLSGAQKYAWLLIIEGIIICIWIAVQLIFKIKFSMVQAVFLLLGLIFIYTGMLKTRTALLP